MEKFFVFSWLVAICSCSSKQNSSSEELEIVIKHAHSYKYDLANQTYTVFMRQGDTTIYFTLTDYEKKQIASQYYDLQLNEITGKQTIEDNCDMMPKLHSVLKVNSKTQSQEITIDDGCGDYKGIFDTKGKRITAFLGFVKDMLRKKSEIRMAPKSDIPYL